MNTYMSITLQYSPFSLHIRNCETEYANVDILDYVLLLAYIYLGKIIN